MPVKILRGLYYLFLFQKIRLVLSSSSSSSSTTTTMCDYDIIIVGGGIAGHAIASGLLHHGSKNNGNNNNADANNNIQQKNRIKSKIQIYEKALSFEPIGAAIGLFPNGLQALQHISPTAYEKVIKSAIKHKKALTYDLDGKTLLREIDFNKIDLNKDNGAMVSPIYLVWYLLQKYLREDFFVEDTTTTTTSYNNHNNNNNNNILQLGHIVKSFTINDSTGIVTVTILNRRTNKTFTKTCKILIGADGIRSNIRTQLLNISTKRNYQGKVSFRGVIPKDKLDSSILKPIGYSTNYQGNEKGKLFAYRETALNIITFTAQCTFLTEEEAKQQLILDQQDKNTIQNNDDTTNMNNMNNKKKENILSIFKDFPIDVQNILQTIPSSSIYINVMYDIPIISSWSKGPIILIGDAAHAMTSGMGQGANQGLEDACELSYVLSNLLYCNNKKNDNDNDNDTDTTDVDTNNTIEFQTKIIPTILEQFWKNRINRVKGIHTLSRKQTHQANQSTKETNLFNTNANTNTNNDNDDGGTKKFTTKELYEWKPSFVVSSSSSNI